MVCSRGKGAAGAEDGTVDAVVSFQGTQTFIPTEVTSSAISAGRVHDPDLPAKPGSSGPSVATTLFVRVAAIPFRNIYQGRTESCGRRHRYGRGVAGANMGNEPDRPPISTQQLFPGTFSANSPGVEGSLAVRFLNLIEAPATPSPHPGAGAVPFPREGAVFAEVKWAGLVRAAAA